MAYLQFRHVLYDHLAAGVAVVRVQRFHVGVQPVALLSQLVLKASHRVANRDVHLRGTRRELCHSMTSMIPPSRLAGSEAAGGGGCLTL